MFRWLVLSGTHGAMLVVGFVLGIYMLPILIAPDSPDEASLRSAMQSAEFNASFTRELEGSDALHWGEGTVSLSPTQIVHMGSMSPGPDYRVYLVTDFVETEAQFLSLKDTSLQVGSLKSFDGFIVDLPPGTDLDAYTTVLVWCEAFGEFITAAKYR